MPSFLGRLIGRSAPRPTSRATVFRGHETLEVVGESQYQDALWDIVGGFRRDPVRCAVEAALVPEPENPYDANAIRVDVEGRCTGYLCREDAVVYRPGLLRLMESGSIGHVALEGHIVGGGPRGDRIGFLGVFLDHDPADFGIAPHHTTGGTLRTGLSQAIATDLDDDSYDLSWLRTLAQDDALATDQLGALLEDERDPIDRHYMLAELEHRLYRSRDAAESALDQFDAVCLQHHHEMTTIRPALLDKFGVIPVIEMYRQAATSDSPTRSRRSRQGRRRTSVSRIRLTPQPDCCRRRRLCAVDAA
ncbi:MAG: hypothetical protein V7607_4529 [Solirubrobacteraceae bacterium]